MRVSNTPKRHKNRSNGSRRSNISSNNFEGNGKDNKIKGNAIQVHEKYQALARDAISSGDVVKAEYYFQHAEHYHRIHKTSLAISSEKKIKKHKEFEKNNTNIKIDNTESKNENLPKNN